jgi:hypothetical protein
MDNVIYEYTLEQAIKDGVLVEVFKNRWKELTGGKPLVATSHIMAELSLAALQEISNEYLVWRKNVMPTLPEEDQLFSTTMNDETVWVLEDGQAFTILYPEDY